MGGILGCKYIPPFEGNRSEKYKKLINKKWANVEEQKEKWSDFWLDITRAFIKKESLEEVRNILNKYEKELFGDKK